MTSRGGGLIDEIKIDVRLCASPPHRMTEPSATVEALNAQAGYCRAGGSPLNAALLERAAADCFEGGPVLGLMAPWANQDMRAHLAAATVLRLVAALHELALSGEDPKLSAAYATLDAETVWRAAVPAMVTHGGRLAAFMTHEPQTNEVRRSIGLLGGFLEVAKATGLPLRCFEIGASAGLNTSWDRYRYQMGEATWGDPDAAVLIDTAWSGGPPPVEAALSVIHRAACDRRPTDLTDPDQRRRLLAYIWADQRERLARIEAAIEVTLAHRVEVETADAVDWTRANVAPSPGTATVLFHSVFWQYLPVESRTALAALIREIGASATLEAPFAWLRMEPTHPTNPMVMQIRLTQWPGGIDRLLAETHPHGATVNWVAG